MNRPISFVALVVLMLTSCAPAQPIPTRTLSPALTPQSTVNVITTNGATPFQTPTSPTSNELRWDIYDSNPQHLWNRLFRQLYRRTTSDGREFGWDSLDPLLWYDTTYLLEGDSYKQTIQLLDEFLSTRGEDLITDSLKRAMFQRDMWAVFDWLTARSDSYPTQSREFQRRLAQVIRKVALTEKEILSLPDNYEAAVKSQAFATNYQSEMPSVGYIPTDLLQPNSAWVCVGRAGGPIAMSHTEEFPFFGRSVFLIFIRIPGGREATLRFLQELNSETPPSLVPDDAEVALVRRAVLINDKGGITPSPIVESVQMRHFNHGDYAQNFYEFQLHRVLLFAGISGGLQPGDKGFLLFHSVGDEFKAGDGVEESEMLPNICFACHGSGGFTMNLLSYSRRDFPLSGSGDVSSEQKPLVLMETTPELETQTVITWKQRHPTWQAFEELWSQATP